MPNYLESIHIPTYTHLELLITNSNGDSIMCAADNKIYKWGDYSSLYGIVAHNGLEYTERELTGKEYAQQDGGYIAGNRKKMRRITLVLKKRCAGIGLGYRPERFFSSKGMYTIVSFSMVKDVYPAIWLDNSESWVQRTISGYIEHIERIGQAGKNAPIVLQVTFLCPDAYFSDDFGKRNQTYFGKVSSGLQYKDNKLQYSTDKKLIQYERMSFVKTIFVNNAGSTETGFVLTVTTAAPAASFYIKVNGETAQFGDIPKESTLVVNTAKRTLTLNGENAYSLSKNRVFPMLRPGRNEIEISNVVGSACIEFSAKHEGVY